MRATSIYFARRHHQKALKMTKIHNLRYHRYINSVVQLARWILVKTGPLCTGRCYIQRRCSITVPYYPCHAMMLFTPANIRLNSFIALFSKCFRINLFPDFSLLKGTNTRSSTVLLVLKKCFATAFSNILFSMSPLWPPRRLTGSCSKLPRNYIIIIIIFCPVLWIVTDLN